jgi:hypothetical protein
LWRNEKPLTDPDVVLKILYTQEPSHIRRIVNTDPQKPYLQKGCRDGEYGTRNWRNGHRYLLAPEVVEELTREGCIYPHTNKLNAEFRITPIGQERARRLLLKTKKE